MSEHTTDPRDPRLTHGVDAEPVPQAAAYLVLPAEARAEQPRVRPLRHQYMHVGPPGTGGGCGTTTSMSGPLAETYARIPGFYGATYCVRCRMHLPVGAQGVFVWVEDDGRVTAERVGT